jgi:2-phosphosulfolactate phosphatase
MTTRRFEWGPVGARRLAQEVDVLVVVDTMSFSTAVDVAVARGAVVCPTRWSDESAALSRDRPYSLSPASMTSVPSGTRLELASPNGATICLDAAELGPAVIAGCLRNASAVAAAAGHAGDVVGVIAAGERWPDGSLRPALEDLLGAGVILDALGGEPSPDARAAIAAARAVTLDDVRACHSARELIDAGFAEDVDLAVQRDVSTAVPLLRDGAFTNSGV